MRHTFASQLLQDGAPITYVSRQLGHKDAAITLRVYAHWLPNYSWSRPASVSAANGGCFAAMSLWQLQHLAGW